MKEAKPTAVVVHDDPALLGLLTGLLVRDGIRACAFENAEAALSVMGPAEPPDLVVTGLHMAGIDGWSFCRLLRSPEYAAFNAVPVLVVSTTFVRDHLERIAVDVGANAFLPTPLDELDYVATARALLTGQKVDRRPRLLIARGDPDSAESLKAIFAAHGYQADTALLVREAEAAISRVRYDLAVLDDRLPDGTVETLLEVCRAERPDCVCVVMSAHPSRESALNWMKRGAAAHLHKATDAEQLVEMCARACRERTALRSEDLLEARTRELRDSEERHRSLFMEMQEGFALHEMICDDAGRPCDYRYLEVNPAFERATGIPRGRWIGHTVREVIPDVEDYWIGRFGEVALTGKVAKFENYVRELDQHYEVVAYCPKRGQFAVVILNITERKRMEEALRANEERLRETAAIARVGGWEIDLQGNTLSWTEETFRIHELESDRLPAVANAIQFYHPDDQGKVTAAVQRAIEGAGGFDLEARLITAKRNVLWIRAMGRTVSREGQRAGVRGMIQDITERKQSELALQRRDVLLDAAAFASGLLLTSETPAEALGEIVRLLGEASGQDRTHFFAWQADSTTGQVTVSLRHEWARQGIAPQQGNPLLQDLPFSRMAPYSCDRLRRGLEICALVRDLPGSEREVFGTEQAVSLLLVPVMANAVPEGFIGFYSCHTEYAWTAGERAALTVVATNLGAALARSRAEVALRESEARFRSLAQNIPGVVYLCRNDESWTMLYLSDAVRELTGYPKEAFLSNQLSFASLYDPEDLPGIYKQVDASLAQGVPFHLIYRIKHRDGTWRWIEEAGVGIPGPNNTTLIEGHLSDRTAAMNAEKVLRESEARFRELADQLPEVVFEMDASHRLIFTNRRAFDLFGYTPEELASLPDPVSVLAFEDRPRAREMLARRLQKEDLGAQEYTGLRKDGTTFPLLLHNRAIFRDGVHVGFRGVIIDISDHRRAEAELAHVRRRLETASAAGRVALWELDVSSGRLEWSDAVDTMLGLASGTFERSLAAWLDVIHPEDRPRVDQALAAHLDHAVAYDVEYRVRRANGSWAWWRDTGTAQRDAQGKPLTMAGACTDVTDRRLAEEALRERQEIINTIVESSQDWIWAIDAHGIHTFSNPASQQILGRGLDEILGRANLDLLHEEDCALVQDMFPEHVRERRGWKNLLLRWRHKDGSCRYLESNAVPIVDAAGTLTGFRGVDRDVTERHKAEEALRKSEERFRGILQNVTTVAVQGYSMDGTVRYWNRASETFYGYTAEEALGRTLLDLIIPPAMRDEFREAIRLMAETGETIPASELELMHKDGSVIPVYSSRVVVRVPGQDAELFCIDINLTERQEAERRQQLAAEVLSILNESLPLPDAIHRILAAIQRNTGLDAVGIRLREGGDFPYFAQQGFTQDFVLAENSLTIPSTGGTLCRHPDGSLQLECTCGLVLSGKTDASNSLFTKGGSAWTNCSTSLLDLPAAQDPRLHPRNRCIREGYASVALIPLRIHQEIVGLLQLNDRRPNRFNPELIRFYESLGASIGVSLTRQHAAETLQQKEERFRALIEHSHDAITLLAADGTILFDSAAITHMLGYTTTERIGRSGFDYVHPEDRDHLTQSLADLRSHPGGMVTYQARILHRDGSYRWIEGVRTNLLHEPAIQAVVVNFRDITERKRAEEEREKLQSQLLQAQKMESVGRLAGGVAHDFNNMLTAILGHVDLALQELAPDSLLHDNLTEIQNCARRSADLTRQLLAFARRQTIAPKVLDLNETIEGMLKMLRRLIGEDIELVWKPDHGLWPVRLDPSQVDQVLANLCVNARDAISGVGKVTIETSNAHFDEEYCSHHAGFAPGDYVQLAVSDNGCGMDAETLSHLFEPFFTTKEVGKGTGLGLATVYGAVKQNSGFVNVDSEPGQGTTFKIFLPRHKATEPTRTEARPPRATAGGRETILLVEDEPAILNLTRRVLERLGYTVLAARTPGEAIRMAQEHPASIDLLLTDVVMPEMNGRDLALSILALHPNIKRLFSSGYTANVIAHQGVLDPGVHFIQKPFSPHALANKVRDVLEHHS